MAGFDSNRCKKSMEAINDANTALASIVKEYETSGFASLYSGWYSPVGYTEIGKLVDELNNLLSGTQRTLLEVFNLINFKVVPLVQMNNDISWSMYPLDIHYVSFSKQTFPSDDTPVNFSKTLVNSGIDAIKRCLDNGVKPPIQDIKSAGCDLGGAITYSDVGSNIEAAIDNLFNKIVEMIDEIETRVDGFLTKLNEDAEAHGMTADNVAQEAEALSNINSFFSSGF